MKQVPPVYTRALVKPFDHCLKHHHPHLQYNILAMTPPAVMSRVTVSLSDSSRTEQLLQVPWTGRQNLEESR
jgi:hypothetical protein